MRRMDVTDILILCFIFASIILEAGDSLLKLMKVLFFIPCYINILKSQKLYIDTYVKWMFCFAAFAGFSFTWAISVSSAAYRYQTLLLNMICIYCLLVYINNRADRIKLILNALTFAPVLLGMRVIISYGWLAFAATREIAGMMSPNAIGMRAGIAVVLGAYLLFTEQKHHMIYLLSIVLNTSIVVMTGSRKAIFFILIPLLLYYIGSQKNSLKFIKSFALSGILVGAVCYAMLHVPYIYDMVGSRMEMMLKGIMHAGQTDGSTSLRLAMINWGIEWFKLKPWFGYGINNYMNLLGTMDTSFGTSGVYAHNNYIEMLVNLGLIGTIIYYFIYLKILVRTVLIRNRLNPLQLMMSSILAAIMVCEYGMVTYCELYAQIILVLVWIVLFPREDILIERRPFLAVEKSCQLR